MFFVLTASPQGFSASLLYGQPAGTAIHGGGRGNAGQRRERPADSASIIDVEATPVERISNETSAPRRAALTARPAADQRALIYAVAQGGKGRAPRLLNAPATPGQRIDVYA
jgi:hypothetical protein